MVKVDAVVRNVVADTLAYASVVSLFVAQAVNPTSSRCVRVFFSFVPLRCRNLSTSISIAITWLHIRVIVEPRKCWKRQSNIESTKVSDAASLDYGI